MPAASGARARNERVPARRAGPPRQQAEQSVRDLRGAHLARIDGKYHLFVTGRLFRNGLGRTGLPEGADDVLVAASERPAEGYSDFYVAFPHAGQTTVFEDAAGALWATYSGGDARAMVRGRPAAFRVGKVSASVEAWTIGFAGTE